MQSSSQYFTAVESNHFFTTGFKLSISHRCNDSWFFVQMTDLPCKHQHHPNFYAAAALYPHTSVPPSAVVVRWFSACRGWCCEAVIKGQQWQNRSGMGVSRTGPASPREITLFWVRRDDIMTDGDEDVGTEGRKCYLTMAPNGSRQTQKHAYMRLT